MTTKHKWPVLPQGQLRFPRFFTNTMLDGVPVFDPAKIPQTSWVIDNFLASGSIQHLWGDFGTYKSTLLTLAAWKVSRGEPFLGMKTVARPVLYFDYENPPDVIAQRCSDLGITLPAPMFTIWDRFKGEEPPVPKETEKLKRFFSQSQKYTGLAPWFIFDSWTSLLRNRGDDKDRVAVAQMFKSIRKITDLGAVVTVIDHSNRNHKYHGSEAKMTQMDSIHELKKKKSPHTVVGADSTLLILSARDLE